jgi:hypothetical protein
MLFPQALRTNHNFGVLALNRNQFADICEAFGRYLVDEHSEGESGQAPWPRPASGW